MDATMDRVLYLLNASFNRDLTAAEQEFFDENYSRFLDAEEEEVRRIDTEEDSDTDNDGDLSDADDPNYEPDTALLDTRVSQAGLDMEEEEEAERQQQGSRNGQEDEDPIAPNRGMRYVARNAKFDDIWWSMPDESERQRTIRNRNERMRHVPKCTNLFSRKAEVFKSLVTPNIVGNIVLETNRKAKRTYEENRLSLNPKQMRRWYDTFEEEIYAYILILLYAGAEKAYGVEAKDLFHPTSVPFYRAVMSLERFEQIRRFIRFDDGRTRAFRLQTDKLAAFRYVWDLFQQNLVEFYQPSKELTVDEQLVGSRGRCPFKMFMPNKPGKYCIKIFWIVDAVNSYPLRGEIYVGQQPCDNRSDGISHQLVMRLAERYLGMNYNITTDNYFTSVPLALELMSKRTTTIGTIKSNKPQLPKPFTPVDKIFRQTRDKFSIKFCYSRCLQLCSYASNTKKNVLMLSTAHHEDKIDEVTKKPAVIMDYNSTKGGVDTFDRLATVYTCKRKTNRWPVTLFYNLLDCAGVAAYRMFDVCQPNWYSSKKRSEKRKKFLKELAFELADNHIKNRIAKPTLQKSVKTAMSLIGYEITSISTLPTIQQNKAKQRCDPCKKEKRDNKTTAVCDLCYVAACSKHYIRVCEKCFVTKSAIDTTETEEDENFDGDSLPSTSAGPPAKRQKNRNTN
ncbi:piggyBac transposable element-derived protein 4-like [Episyrphus balteatus]|uniref:piggyBac transposable element-derived protein 4-like n=1 Tax=Episyrphus balteatus TaxID=286459 RepID=UPI0024858F78|nr:piggyBac transposable element-derived protein 4-like [Episyrphus balteatus]